MIVINENSVNTFVLTLTEKVTLSAPVFLFHFKSIQEQQDYYVIISDTSLFTRRFNEFTFIEGVNDVLNGKLIFGAGGQYEYFIYEQTSTTNLNPAILTDALVEKGFMELDRGNTAYTQHTISEKYSTHQVT